MNHQPETSEEEVLASLLIRGGLALLVLIVWFIATANGLSPREAAAGGSRIIASRAVRSNTARLQVPEKVQFTGENFDPTGTVDKLPGGQSESSGVSELTNSVHPERESKQVP